MKHRALVSITRAFTILLPPLSSPFSVAGGRNLLHTDSTVTALSDMLDHSLPGRCTTITLS
jgi:hypothetical protein